MIDGINNQNSQVDAASGSNRFGPGVFNTTSIELVFAQLQMELSKDNKELAREKINQIKADQEVQKQFTDYVVQLRNLINGKKDDDEVKDSKVAGLVIQMNTFLSQNGFDTLSLSGCPKVKDINLAIQSLQNMQETVGSSVQQEMLLIQDMMSKVSSYSQGAASAVNKAGDTLTAILR
jgi:hypothetical protein